MDQSDRDTWRQRLFAIDPRFLQQPYIEHGDPPMHVYEHGGDTYVHVHDRGYLFRHLSRPQVLEWLDRELPRVRLNDGPLRLADGSVVQLSRTHFGLLRQVLLVDILWLNRNHSWLPLKYSYLMLPHVRKGDLDQASVLDRVRSFLRAVMGNESPHIYPLAAHLLGVHLDEYTERMARFDKMMEL